MGIYFTAQLRNDASIAIAGEVCADLADYSDDDRILDPLTSRFLVVGRAREIHELASSRDGKTGGPLTINIGSFVVDGLFLKRPLKKSRSIVSRPTIRSRAAILASPHIMEPFGRADLLGELAGLILCNP